MKYFILFSAILTFPLSAADYKPIILDTSYDHNKWGTTPTDIERKFRAYTVSFDSNDDDDGDTNPDIWGIPHWVAYELKKFDGELGKGPKRPSPWLTDKPLYEQKIAPNDKTYHFSNIWRNTNSESTFIGYDRGHMCMKIHAFRLGKNADWNTHTMLNACPQRSKLNQGIWLNLENKCAKWADTHNSIWIITGPIIYGLKPTQYLGQNDLNEVMIAIPDAFFKIIVREIDGEDPAILAFIYPQRGKGYKKSGGYDHTPYLTNVRAIEKFTELKFFTNLDTNTQEKIKKITATELWEN